MAGLLAPHLEYQIAAEQKLAPRDFGRYGPASNPGFVRRASSGDALDEQTALVIQVEKGREAVAIEKDGVEARPRTVFESQQLFGRVDRDDESKALKSSRFRQDARRDANHFALRVEHRSAAIARVDGRVGLDELREDRAVIEPVELAKPADIAERVRVLQPIGCANDIDGLSDSEQVGIAERGVREVGRGRLQ